MYLFHLIKFLVSQIFSPIALAPDYPRDSDMWTILLLIESLPPIALVLAVGKFSLWVPSSV